MNDTFTIHTCDACPYYCQACPLDLFSAAELQDAGILEVANEWQRRENARRQLEDQRLHDNGVFTYEPYYFDWCAAHTYLGKQYLDKIARALHSRQAKNLQPLLTALYSDSVEDLLACVQSEEHVDWRRRRVEEVLVSLAPIGQSGVSTGGSNGAAAEDLEQRARNLEPEAIRDLATRYTAQGELLITRTLQGDWAALQALLSTGILRVQRLLRWARNRDNTAITRLVNGEQVQVIPATGEVKLIYRVCQLANQNGQCAIPRLAGMRWEQETNQPQVDSSAKSQPAERKISVKGYIHIGREMDLVQGVASNYTPFGAGGPVGMSELERSPFAGRSADESRQRLTYHLEEPQEVGRCLNPDCWRCLDPACGKLNRVGAKFCSKCGKSLERYAVVQSSALCPRCGGPLEGEIYIQNDGLCAAYGVFGAAGSGKTNLLLYMLRQILGLHKDDPERKFGALILDPKAALIGDVQRILESLGRKDDLYVINTEDLTRRGAEVNVIDCAFEPEELGNALVLAAMSAGAGASDPYWFQAMSDLFGAVLRLLKLRREMFAGTDEGREAITLRKLLEVILETNGGKRGIESLMADVKAQFELDPDTWDRARRRDPEVAFETIKAHLQNKDAVTVEQFMSQAYKLFRLSKYACFSPLCADDVAKPFYDQIIEDGKIVLVAISPADEKIAQQLCTLIKCLFQKTVLSRLIRCDTAELNNFTRPLILACDEYSRIASEVAGTGTGDGAFFSQARQFGCMGLLATQSVNVLEATPMREHWRSVFSNFGAKLFMRLADNETASQAKELAGQSDWYIVNMGASQSKEGVSTSAQRELRQRDNLPTEILTQVFTKGDGVILGSLDGSNTPGVTRFVHVPRY